MIKCVYGLSGCHREGLLVFLVRSGSDVSFSRQRLQNRDSLKTQTVIDLTNTLEISSHITFK